MFISRFKSLLVNGTAKEETLEYDVECLQSVCGFIFCNVVMKKQ